MPMQPMPMPATVIHFELVMLNLLLYGIAWLISLPVLSKLIKPTNE